MQNAKYKISARMQKANEYEFTGISRSENEWHYSYLAVD